MKNIYPGLNGALFYVQFWLVLMHIWEGFYYTLIPIFFLIGKFTKSYKFIAENRFEKEENLVNIKTFNELKVKNISFKYHEAFIFKYFNINIKNQFIFIDGISGIGKSTLFNLILNSEKLQSGFIFINDINVNKIDNMSEIVTYLPQKDAIFNESIKTNIVLNKEFDEDKLNNLLEVMKFEDFVNLEEIDGKQCGVGGSKISGGQAKRICIARALLFDNENNLLLLDEPFNNLNQELIDRIINYLSTLKGNKTIICIDHTGNFQRIADQTVLIK